MTTAVVVRPDDRLQIGPLGHRSQGITTTVAALLEAVGVDFDPDEDIVLELGRRARTQTPRYRHG